MPEVPPIPRGVRLLLAAASLVVIVAGLRAAAPVLAPLALSLFLAILFLPLQRFLRRHRWPVSLAVAVTMLCVFALLTAVVLLVLGSLGGLSESLPVYQAALAEKLSYTVEWWEQKGIRLSEWLPALTARPQSLVGLLGKTLLRVGNLFSQLVLVLLTMVFLLFEALNIPTRLAVASGGRVHPELFSRITDELQRYLGLKVLISAALGGLVAGWTSWMGLDFAVMLGLVAFACHFIPNVGALLAALPAMLLAFAEYDTMWALVVGLGYLALAVVVGNLIEPLLLGRRLRLSALVVFVSLVFWGWVWGPIGMLLSVPLTLGLRIVCEHVPSLVWITALLDSKVPAAVAERLGVAETGVESDGSEGKVAATAEHPDAAAPQGQALAG